MKKRIRRVVPAILSVAMTVSSVPGAAFGAPLVTAFSSDEAEDIQMVSDPETVFINSYDGSVRSQNFNENWKFFLGDAGNAQDVNFNDSKWRSVNLPHDYSIEQEYSENMEAESGYLPGGTGWYRKNFTVPKDAMDKQIRVDFDGVYMNATVYINGKEVGTHPYGYSPFSFDLTPYLNYGGDNVIAVKVEHRTPSSRWYSGSGIYRDVKLTITPMVHEALNGTKIELPDLAENQSTPTVHVETSVQNESGSDEQVTVSHIIYKKGDESKTPVGEITAEPVTVAAGATVTVESDMTAASPDLWTLDSPELYVMETKINTGGGITDTTTSDFGFRYFDFDSSTGFSLNGENMKLKGVCMHHDQGSLGSEAWHRAMERQVEILKEMGCNAIRVTHNPAAKDLIDICNEKGMLVIEEMFDGWHKSKNGNSEDFGKWYGQTIGGSNQILGKTNDSMTWAEFDLKSVIQRDWNAPSVISWSLGNEVMEGISGGTADYPDKARDLINWAREMDTTRPVTTGDNKLKSGNAQSKAIAQALAEVDGLVGFNYTTLTQGNGLDQYHQNNPDWIIYGSETASSINSRGVYNPGLFDRQLTAYDESKVGWGHLASDAWYNTIQKDYVAGEFVWTGFDYIGEPTNWNGTASGAVGDWPSPKNSYFGIVDTAGLPKDSYYLYQSLWNDDVNTLHILPAWNEDVVQKNNQNQVKVVVYSDAPTVELWFTPADGGEKRLIGTKTMTEKQSVSDSGEEGLYTYYMYEGEGKDGTAHKNLYRTWMVPYEDGTLEAVAKDAEGHVISNTEGRNMVSTAGEAEKLELSADRDTIDADGADLCYVTVNVTDSKGNLVPDAQNRVTFSVEGDGVLVGVDNGWTTDHDSYQANNRRAFNGQLVAIVQSTKEAGSFTLTASADGLEGASVTVETQQTESEVPEPGDENQIASYEISKNYYVKVGNEPILPEELTATYTDGTTEELPVTWDTIDQDRLDEVGSFVLSGDMDGTKVSVSINMINQIAAILNYSTTVHVNEKPILPESRQIVSEDGEILNIALPVEWEELDDEAYSEIGTVTVNGTATVFGEPMDVTASVRVQDEEKVITDNVGTKAEVSQTVGTTSDTLEAVNDGKTVSVDSPNGGANTSRWSNWDWTKTNQNDPPAELLFTYATQETLGQIKIYFVRDNNSLRFPDEGNTKIYISDDQENWTELHTLGMTETIPENETSNMVKCYTYDFAPVGATYVKFEFHNNTTGANMPTTGVTEIELYRSEGRFVANKTAALSSLTINGVEVPASSLEAGEYNTPMAVVEELQAASDDNAAITVLPAYDKQVKIILESEDHSTQDEFIIHLEQESTGTADDASMDYPASDMQVTASSEETSSENAPATNVLDGKESTFWHSKYSGGGNEGPLWIQLELEEETTLGALRYCPRSGNSANGRVNEYRVEVSTDGEKWTEVSNGTWPNATGWKLAQFEEPVKAKYVKLTGVHTYGDTADKFMTAAEIRVRTARETTKLTEDNVTLDQDIYTMEESGEPIKPEVTVTADGHTLKYGIDYTLTYENNDRPGTAAVIVKGIMDYSGTVRREFRIMGENSQEITAVGGTIVAIEGEEFTGIDQAQAESGKLVTVKADEKEGFEFDHWRTAPTNLLSGEEAKKEEVTFTVPVSSSRLVAVYREEGEKKVEKESYSTTEPESWFAYGESEDLDSLLNEAMTDSDEMIIARGGTVALDFNLEYGKKAPSKMDVLKMYQRKASPSDAEEDEDRPALLDATASDAKASPSDASEAFTGGRLDARSILSSEVPSPLKAVEEELGTADDEEMAKTTRIAFWITAQAEKITTDSKGNVTREILTDSELPQVQVAAELLKEHRRMEDYRVIRYEFDEDGATVSEESCELQGNNLVFDASVDGIYAVVYTQCFDVVFEDWDGTVLDKQRVPYGEAAEEPEAPTREGYRFTGWSRDFDEVTSDLVIKAQYEKGEEEPEVNKSRLEAKIAEISRKMDSLNEEEYTEASWSTLEDALEEAVSVFEDEDATQKEVNKAAENLDKAYKALKKVPETPETPENPDKPDKPNNGGGHHSGGGGSSSSGGHYYASQQNLETISDEAVPLAGGLYVTEGSWAQSENGWTFVKADGTKAVSSWIYTVWDNAYNWYYFNAEGVMATGWLDVDGHTFYLNPVSDGTRGMMVTGWQMIDGKYYYFNPVSDGTRGALYRNAATPDGYRVGADGAWIQ